MKGKIGFFLYFISFLHLSNIAFGQEKPIKKPAPKQSKYVNTRCIFLAPSYTASFPVGILSKRFGYSNQIGFQIGYVIGKNWSITPEFKYFFTSKVIENTILAPISTSTGQQINSQGNLGSFKFQGTGYLIHLQVGKYFPLSKKRPGLGLQTNVGVGYMQHKIWLNLREDLYPQLNKTYRQGYDRLSSGPFVSAFVGFMKLERKKLLNLFIGPSVDIGFTQNRRAINFDTGLHDATKRIDVFVGIKLGLLLPIYKLSSADNDEYY